MPQLITLNAPGGAGLPLMSQPGATQLAAEAAMEAGDLRCLILPTFGGSKSYLLKTATECYLYDAMFGQLGYTSEIAGAPVPVASDVAPSMSWSGLATRRGFVGTQETQMDAYGSQSAGFNPDFWGAARVKLGTDDDLVHFIIGADNDYSAYGDGLLVKSTWELEMRLGNESLPFAGPEASPNTWHTYSWRYSSDDDTLRTYRDGVLQITSVVQTVRPGAQCTGGRVFVGGRTATGALEAFNATGSAFKVGAMGNGRLSDAQHAAILTWFASLD